jgi:hypothetical protein
MGRDGERGGVGKEQGKGERGRERGKEMSSNSYKCWWYDGTMRVEHVHVHVGVGDVG